MTTFVPRTFIERKYIIRRKKRAILYLSAQPHSDPVSFVLLYSGSRLAIFIKICFFHLSCGTATESEHITNSVYFILFQFFEQIVFFCCCCCCPFDTQTHCSHTHLQKEERKIVTKGCGILYYYYLLRNIPTARANKNERENWKSRRFSNVRRERQKLNRFVYFCDCNFFSIRGLRV